MLVHIVLFKFKADARDQIEPARAALAALPHIIPEIKHYELGVDIVQSERSYDLALYSKFESLDALKVYQAHPVHQEVLAMIRAATSSIITVDYEVI